MDVEAEVQSVAVDARGGEISRVRCLKALPLAGSGGPARRSCHFGTRFNDLA